MCVKKTKKTKQPVKKPKLNNAYARKPGLMAKCRKCPCGDMCGQGTARLIVALGKGKDAVELPILDVEFLVDSCELRKRLRQAMIDTVTTYNAELKSVAKELMKGKKKA